MKKYKITAILFTAVLCLAGCGKSGKEQAQEQLKEKLVSMAAEQDAQYNATTTTSAEITILTTTTTNPTTTTTEPKITTTTQNTATYSNEELYNSLLKRHENDNSGVKYYCDEIEEMTNNGTPCDVWMNMFYVTLYTDPNTPNSGEGYVFTIGSGSGYCEWSHMQGSGYYYIRWYPSHYPDGSYLDLISCHLTTDLPDLSDSFVG